MSVSYELEGAVAVITVDDGKANAYSHEVLAGLHDALSRAEGEATAVLIVGRPGRFSAGFDLSVMSAGDAPMRALVTAGAELLVRVFTFPMPVVVACTGHALAAGALMLLVADHRIGAEGSFKVGLNEVAIGMSLPLFAVELARYRMPPSRFDSALVGEVFDPSGAVTAGYLDRIVDGDALLDDAKATAQRLSQLRTGAVSHTKVMARGAIAEHILATLEADMATIGGPSSP
jgi:enoyl-CoA hydratase